MYTSSSPAPSPLGCLQQRHHAHRPSSSNDDHQTLTPPPRCGAEVRIRLHRRLIHPSLRSRSRRYLRDGTRGYRQRHRGLIRRSRDSRTCGWRRSRRRRGGGRYTQRESKRGRLRRRRGRERGRKRGSRDDGRVGVCLGCAGDEERARDRGCGGGG